MATPKHLQILQHGVEAWNAWRNDRRGITPNLRGGGNFREADLSGADSTGFRGKNLKR